MLEEVAERTVDHAVLADLCMCHAGVGGDLASGKATVLAIARGLHACADRFGGFARLFLAKFVDRECGSFDVDINTVEKRATDARAVALDLGG